ncbi:hypothetical protein DL764_004812 [Monosporascus ibericus]|uniref:Uncharacterized protein n=1 Tax=Monosporascus ibericus TaxID=155417 RepID=A0A4Q4TB89_9PEZI|nr:hypothetical protein DL764_004812 [Monosporascus ibericus]
MEDYTRMGSREVPMDNLKSHPAVEAGLSDDLRERGRRVDGLCAHNWHANGVFVNLKVAEGDWGKLQMHLLLFRLMKDLASAAAASGNVTLARPLRRRHGMWDVPLPDRYYPHAYVVAATVYKDSKPIISGTRK